MANSDLSMNSTLYAPLHLDQVLPTDGTSQRKRQAAPFWIWLARLFLRIGGWKLYGHLPDIDKFVLAAAYHTSNWDGFWMLCTAYAFGLRPQFLVKHEWTKGFFGPLVRFFGGVGIDRKRSRNAVEGMAEIIRNADRVMFVISPEGTRRKTDHWKTGFYWIAQNANVPIICGFLDYKYRRCGVGPVIIPSGDINADMEQIFDFYRQTNAKHPEKSSDMRLRPYTTKED
jgi:1-acyl-sn-glycerol-3-phosphate acyltransferase